MRRQGADGQEHALSLDHEVPCHSSIWGNVKARSARKTTSYLAACPRRPVIYLPTNVVYTYTIPTAHRDARSAALLHQAGSRPLVAVCSLAPVCPFNFGVFTSKQCLGRLPRALYPIYSISLRPSVRGYPANANLYKRLQNKANPFKSHTSPPLSITQYAHSRSHQGLSIARNAGPPQHGPLGVVLLVLMMLLVLVLLPRVSTQRHVRHVA